MRSHLAFMVTLRSPGPTVKVLPSAQNLLGELGGQWGAALVGLRQFVRPLAHPQEGGKGRVCPAPLECLSPAVFEGTSAERQVGVPGPGGCTALGQAWDGDPDLPLPVWDSFQWDRLQDGRREGSGRAAWHAVSWHGFATGVVA